MRVLVVGSGGREHALSWKIAASPLLTQLFIAPGNPGTEFLGQNVPIKADDVPGLMAFARDQKIDLIVPGPEAPLMAGLADACAAARIACCGPIAAAARLEGSKAFTKELADAAGIPTAAWERFTDADRALEFVRRRGAPIVVKADGLAAGKGVMVAETVAEAEQAIRLFMQDGALGDAGSTVVIEECLVGKELSVFALCNNEDAVFFGAAQDYKRVGDGDTGPNTGGMGAISPPPQATPAMIDAVMNRIIRPALKELCKRGAAYRGFLYAGLMLTADGPKLIEFNARFGDPECQVVLPRLQSDLLPALCAACDGTLASVELEWYDHAAITVVMAAQGYPGDYERNTVISGVDRAVMAENAYIFHAGTKRNGAQLLSTGGRVLNVGALAPTLAAAREDAYKAIGEIDWDAGFCRRDIGADVIG